MPALTDNLLVKVCSYITDPVTTTDELIPSGETSSYRSNPERLSEFALFRRDQEYVGRSKVLRQAERDREAGRGLFSAYAAKPDSTVTEFIVSTGTLTEAERQIIVDGCLINYYRNSKR